MRKFENGLEVLREKFELVEWHGSISETYVNPNYTGEEIYQIESGAYDILNFIYLLAKINLNLLKKICKVSINFYSYNYSIRNGVSQDRSFLWGDKEFLTQLIEKAYYKKYGIESYSCFWLNKEFLFEIAKENNFNLSDLNLKTFGIFD
jgi:hypothetical protein